MYIWVKYKHSKTRHNRFSKNILERQPTDCPLWKGNKSVNSYNRLPEVSTLAYNLSHTEALSQMLITLTIRSISIVNAALLRIDPTRRFYLLWYYSVYSPLCRILDSDLCQVHPLSLFSLSNFERLALKFYFYKKIYKYSVCSATFLYRL